MRATIWCNHYRAMSQHETCRADVSYDSFKGVPFDSRPCFCKNGQHPNAGCSLQEMPTAEQLAAEEAEMERQWQKIGEARKAIVDRCGGPWKRGAAGVTGVIDCPACGAKESLRFSRAGYNGHIHAACKTDDCVRWME
jgi:hypothetical protein